jgi:NTE family protein
VVDTVAVTADATRSGRAVVFVEAGRDRVLHRSHIIDYVPARIEPAHLRTSAAIPVLFPPVRVDAAGWGAGLVRRRRHPAQHADQAGVGPRRAPAVVIGTDAIRHLRQARPP